MTISKSLHRRMVSGLVVVAMTAALAGPGPVLAEASNADQGSVPADLRALAEALAEGNTGAPVAKVTPLTPEPRPAETVEPAPGSPTAGAPPPQPTGPVGDAAAEDPTGADAPDSRWPSSAMALADLARQRLEALGFDPAADQERRRRELCVFLERMRAPDDTTAPPQPGCTEPLGN